MDACPDCLNLVAEAAKNLLESSTEQAPAATTSIADTPLPAGTRVGRYVVAELLASGGMAHVYRAQDPRLARDVALKMMRPDRLPPQHRNDSRARLLREAQTMARLSHPNVV